MKNVYLLTLVTSVQLSSNWHEWYDDFVVVAPDAQTARQIVHDAKNNFGSGDERRMIDENCWLLETCSACYLISKGSDYQQGILSATYNN